MSHLLFATAILAGICKSYAGGIDFLLELRALGNKPPRGPQAYLQAAPPPALRFEQPAAPLNLAELKALDKFIEAKEERLREAAEAASRAVPDSEHQSHPPLLHELTPDPFMQLFNSLLALMETREAIPDTSLPASVEEKAMQVRRHRASSTPLPKPDYTQFFHIPLEQHDWKIERGDIPDIRSLHDDE